MSKKLGLIQGKLIVPALAALAFGLYPAAAQLAYKDGANAIFVIIVTTFFRALSLVVFCFITSKSWIKISDNWKPVILGGFFQALSVFGIISSLVYLPGPVTIILVFTHTIMLLFFMASRGEIKLTALAVVITIAALVGVGLVVDVINNLNNLKWAGIALAMLAAIATVSRLYIYGKEVQSNEPAVVGARMFAVAFLFSLLLVFYELPLFPHSSTGYVGVLLCSLSLVLGTFGMFYGISLAGAFQFSLIAKLEPIFTAFFPGLF